MRTIHKFPFAFNNHVNLHMPLGAKIIHVDIQDGIYCFWAIVDTSKPLANYSFQILGTGHELPDSLDADHHVGTILHSGFVWHIFER